MSCHVILCYVMSDTSGYGMLFHVMSWYVMLWHVMLCYCVVSDLMLCYVISCHVVLRSDVLCVHSVYDNLKVEPTDNFEEANFSFKLVCDVCCMSVSERVLCCVVASLQVLSRHIRRYICKQAHNISSQDNNNNNNNNECSLLLVYSFDQESALYY